MPVRITRISSNFWQPWSRKSDGFFDGTQTKQFEAEFDLEIHDVVTAEPQKSFRVDAKSIYTGDIEYTLSSVSRTSQLQQFQPANGGQHGLSDRLQTPSWQIGQGTEIDRMGYQPCIVLERFVLGLVRD